MRKDFITVAFVIAVFFTACSPMRISLSNELNNTAELPVKGRNGLLINQRLGFGAFATEKINRSWTEGKSISSGAMKVLWTAYSQKKQSVHFSLTDGMQQRSEVFCLAKVSAEDWTVGENRNSLVNIMTEILGVDGSSDNTFAVNIYLANEPAPREIMLDMQKFQCNSKRYIGYLAQAKDRYYTIHPITAVVQNGKAKALPFSSVGMEIRNKAGIALAAVSLLDNGKVYISSTEAKERFLLANACAAILLHQSLG